MVSYNTEEFRIGVINDLVSKGVILHWWSIVHPAYIEPLTGIPRKEHVHVELLCAGGYDSNDIAKAFDEFDPDHPDTPLGVEIDDKERHVPIQQQLESAMLYDLHDRLYCLYHPKIGIKPYYDLDYNTIQTDSQEWILDVILSAKANYWNKHIHKPSSEDITFAIFNHKPVVVGDKPLTIPRAMHRHWLNSWEFRNLVGMMKTPDEWLDELTDNDPDDD